MGDKAFLVIGSSLLDDIPFRMFDTYDEALSYADSCDKSWPIGPLKVMGRGDIGDDHPSYISIVTFNDGLPVENEVIHDWT